MIDASENSEQKPNLLSSIGQLTTIMVPLLYTLGKKYAAAYFDQLNCGWAINFLTVQETIYNSFPVAFPVFLGMIISMQYMLGGTSSYKVIMRTTYIMLTLAALTLATQLFRDINYKNLLISILCIWVLSIFGCFLTDLFLSMKKNDKPYLTAAVGWTLGGAVAVFAIAELQGSNDAERAISNSSKRWPLVTNGYVFGVSNTQRLVTKVGDKFLILEEGSGKRTFHLISNLDEYSIQSFDQNL